MVNDMDEDDAIVNDMEKVKKAKRNNINFKIEYKNHIFTLIPKLIRLKYFIKKFK